THPVMTAPSSTPPAYTKASPQAPDPATVLVSINRAPEGLSAFQKILFDDGALTYGEVKEAARAMEECLTRAGFPDEAMWVDTGDARTFEWGWAAGGSEAGFRAASEVCRREYWEPL